MVRIPESDRDETGIDNKVERRLYMNNIDHKDKFLDTLGDKLGRFREEPPAGMFERIEQTLLAGGIVEDESEEPKAVVVPLWRRPLFRGVAVALAAACVALALVVTTGRQSVESLGGVEMVADNAAPAESNKEAAQEEEVIPEVASAQGAEEEASAVVAPTARERLAQRFTLAEKSSTNELAQNSPTTITTTEEQPQQGVATESLGEESGDRMAKEASRQGEVSGNDGSAVRQGGSGAASSAATLMAARNNNSSSRRSSKELEEYWRNVLGQESGKRGTSRPVELALYSANLGVNRGDVTQSNISHSQLLVEEHSQLGGGALLGPMMSQEKREATLKHWMPTTLGVTLSLPVNDWLSVESGLLYTSLISKGETSGAMSTYKRVREMEYVGIPLAVRLDVVDIGPLTIYGRLGVTGELSVGAEDRLYIDGALSQENSLVGFDRFTCSFDGAAGVNYSLWDRVGIYGEIGCSYHRAPENYPENYRTVHPLSLASRVGVRFSFD
jgi:hypothetical protein